MPSSRVWLAAALLLTVAVYARLTLSYFCGFDDFTNARRALVEDTAHPAQILTTTHFGTPKYRPLSRAVTLLCEILLPNSALLHRLRNLTFHLLAVALVFGITLRLGGDLPTAAAAAAFFGVHPMAHQTIAAAIFTIGFSYTLMLAALLLFLDAYRLAGNVKVRLGASLALLGAALLAYESTIIVFGCFALYLLIQAIRGEPPAAGWRGFLVPFVSGSAVVLVLFAALRMVFVHGRMPMTPPGKILANLALFGGSLALPVDLLLLNSFGLAPLPNELLQSKRTLAVIAGGGVLPVLLLMVWLFPKAWFRQRLRELPWATILFALASIPLSLLPFVVFTDHPSETYLYLPAAFYAIAMSLFLRGLAGNRAFAMCMGAFILLAATGSWMRTERVRGCAAVAERVMHELPLENWRSGTWDVRVTDAPGTPPMRRFGLYGYRGLGTIDPLESGIRAFEAALQLATRNRDVKGEVVPSGQMPANCANSGTCFQVDAEGHVTPFH